VGLAALLALAACADSTPTTPRTDATTVVESEAEARGGRTSLRVLTHNVYLGGDTGPLYSLDFPNPAEDTPQELAAKTGALLAAVNGFWIEVQASDPHGRAAAIAAEIAEHDPHVVALQEVARYARVDLSAGQPVPVDGRDFRAALEAALAGYGLSYDVVIEQVNTTGQLPLGIDLGTGQFTSVLAFELGELTLVRSDVKVLEAESAEYGASLALGPVSVDRGWSRVRVKDGGMPFDVVNTHLEVQGERDVHDAQAAELIHQVLGGLRGMTVLAGDLNSDQIGAQDESNDAWTPTYAFMRDAGFADAWVESGNAGDGATCCHAQTLDNPTTDFYERIDFVLMRRPGGAWSSNAAAGMSVDSFEIVGDESGDRTAGGLWPADHAGLVADIAFPGGGGS
jgi:endonuclease/exonuclease/phosphatase family metal-dependent hydrolase